MGQDHGRRTAWRRKESHDPRAVFLELERREMRDLETCRQVWEQEGDPLALCEALRQAALPDWLKHALLVFVTDGEAGLPPIRRSLWRQRTRRATDAERALQIAGVRSVRSGPRPALTWDESFRFADELTRRRYEDMPAVGASGLKRAYERVSRGLVNPWRYYRAPRAKRSVVEAWTELVALMRAQAKRK